MNVKTNEKNYDLAIAEIKAIREWDEKQYLLEQELRKLKEIFEGAKVVCARRYLDDLELVFDNMKAVRLTLASIRDL